MCLEIIDHQRKHKNAIKGLFQFINHFGCKDYFIPSSYIYNVVFYTVVELIAAPVDIPRESIKKEKHSQTVESEVEEQKSVLKDES